MERLKAYEDNDTSRIERAHNLHVADKEGRVIVLPCKVGANMIDSTFLEHPRIMKNVRPAVEYEEARESYSICRCKILKLRLRVAL